MHNKTAGVIPATTPDRRECKVEAKGVRRNDCKLPERVDYRFAVANEESEGRCIRIHHSNSV